MDDKYTCTEVCWDDKPELIRVDSEEWECPGCGTSYYECHGCKQRGEITILWLEEAGFFVCEYCDRCFCTPCITKAPCDDDDDAWVCASCAFSKNKNNLPCK